MVLLATPTHGYTTSWESKGKGRTMKLDGVSTMCKQDVSVSSLIEMRWPEDFRIYDLNSCDRMSTDPS